jgi:hypothetical protein
MVPLLFGTAVIIIGLWLRHKSAMAAAWPSVQGMIIESEVVPNNSSTEYLARILYRYEVGGLTYESRQITYTGTPVSLPGVRSIVARYPIGHSVSVFYDPHSPKSAVLENTQNAMWVGVVVFGLIFVGVAVFSR